MKRREFITKTIAGAGGVLACSQFGCIPDPEVIADEGTEFFDPFEKVELGKSGIMMSRLCMGTGTGGWKRQSDQTRTGEEELVTLMREAYERGIDTFDLADMYGSHLHAAKAFAGMDRDKYVLISKIWWRSDADGIPEPERPDADIVVERFLKELKTDYIDLILLHCVKSGQWPDNLRKQMDILASLKEKGVIVAHGVSCHGFDALKACVDQEWVDSVHVRINPFSVRTDASSAEVLPVVKALHKAGKGVVGMKVLGAGDFGDNKKKKDRSIRYVLNSSCVDVITIGFENIEQIDDLAMRVRKVPVLGA